MKRLSLFFTLLLCGILNAEENALLELSNYQPTPSLKMSTLNTDPKTTHDAFFYTDLGVIYLVPTPGLGWRKQSDHLGVDISLKLPLMILPLAYKANTSLLYYPKPNPEGQFYAGIGVTGMAPIFWEFDHTKFAVFGPCLTLGKSYINDSSKVRFWQFALEAFATKKMKFERTKREILPLVSFSYGFCF